MMLQPTFLVKNRELYLFAGIGVINTVVDFTIFTALSTFFVAISPTMYIATRSVSFAAAAMNSFIMNKRFTFPDERRARPHQVGKFFLVTIISFFINMLVGYSLFRILISTLHISSNIIAEISTAVGIIVNALLNFVGYKYIVFKHTHERNI